MNFISLSFIFFLPIVFGITYTLIPRWRICFLLAASYLFYMAWKPGYVMVILLLTVFDFFAAHWIENCKSESGRRIAWMLSLVANLGSLFVFKYLVFATDQMNELFSFLNFNLSLPVPDIILPIGISFHTFQAMSYTTDVYLRLEKAERNFLKFALFIAWFPQMVAGPIERAATLLKQLDIIRFPTVDQIRSGIIIALWGFFKKAVIADNFALLVDLAFSHPGKNSSMTVVLGVYSFAVQIYCDFSGYTDIAIGTSLLFGVQLTQNFERPYLSKSFPEFWKRWHISLSQWFFEYVYFPFVRRFPNGWGPDIGILLVFTLSGVWHGANWNFLVWGLLNGIIYLIYRMLNPWIARWQNRSIDPILIFVNFHLILFCWIFFRSESLHSASQVMHKFGDFLAGKGWFLTSSNETNTSLILGGIALTILVLNSSLNSFVHRVTKDSWIKLTAASVILVLVILSMAQFDNQNFLYFQF